MIEEPAPGLQILTTAELTHLAKENPKFREPLLAELSRRNGSHKANGHQSAEAYPHKTVSPDRVRAMAIRIIHFPPGPSRLVDRPLASKANAALVTKEQLDRFRDRLSLGDRGRFDQYLNGAGVVDDNEPTVQYKRFLWRMSFGRYARAEETTEIAKPPRKLPLTTRPRTLTPEEQLIAKETPGWTLGESSLGEEAAPLSGEECRLVSIRRFPERPRAPSVVDVEPLNPQELSGATDRRICELLQGRLDEATIIKVLQYEILPADLKDIDFSHRNPMLKTEKCRKLLKRFNEAKISATKIRDRIRTVRGKIMRLRKKESNNGNSGCND